MILKQGWAALIRFGFRLLYNELAWTYDLVSWFVSLGDWRAWQRAALPYISGPAVLEIGHGPGHMLLAMQNARYQVVGVDLSPYMGRQARRRTQGAVPLVRAMAQTLPFSTAVFDTVLATFPTEYVLEPATLTAVYRTLRENGRFLIVPEGHLTGPSPLARFIEWLYAITGQRNTPGHRANAPGRRANAPGWRANAPAPDSATRWQPYLARFEAAGFQVQITEVTLPKSRVTILIAHKSAA